MTAESLISELQNRLPSCSVDYEYCAPWLRNDEVLVRVKHGGRAGIVRFALRGDVKLLAEMIIRDMEMTLGTTRYEWRFDRYRRTIRPANLTKEQT